MYVNPALVADLDQLSSGLGLNDLDLPRSVQLLEDAATVAVRSLLGWRLMATVELGCLGAQQVQLTCVEHAVRDRDVRASLLVPLGALTRPGLHADLVFYAGRHGAFARRASDLHRALGHPAGLRLDEDLCAHLVPGFRGLHELATIRRAVDALTGSDGSVEEARGRLAAAAEAADTPVHQMAAEILGKRLT